MFNINRLSCRGYLPFGAAAAALWMSAASPQPALADCGIEAFLDTKTSQEMFLNAAECAVDKALEGGSGTLKEVGVEMASAGLNMIVPGVGTLVSGIVGMSSQESDPFAPYAAELMTAIETSTNSVISAVNKDFTDNDSKLIESLEQGYVLYQSDPAFFRRMVKANSEWTLNQQWFNALDLLALDRHGPPALHAYVSLAEVFSRRLSDLELAIEVASTTPPSNPPTNTHYDQYIASATPEDWEFWVQNASEQARRDTAVIFNGGALQGMGQVSGLFSNVERFANGGFRDYSNSRFSAITGTHTSYSFCGGSIGTPSSHTGTYKFPLDPNDPAASAATYTLTVHGDVCSFTNPNAYYTWYFEVKNAQGTTVYSGTTASLGKGQSTPPFADPMAQLKQAAYEKFLTESYGAVRPVLDQWWRTVGNDDYSAYTADDELDELVERSDVMLLAKWSLIRAAPDWGSPTSDDERQIVNYALTYGSAGLDALRLAGQADQIAWAAHTTRASQYREFLSRNSDPTDAPAYFAGQMAAKVAALGP